MTELRTLAQAAADAARAAADDYRTHGDAHCSLRRPCETALDLMDAAHEAARAAADALAAYLPHGTAVTYTGPRVNLHGPWTVAGVCIGCCHRAAYVLARSNGTTLAHARIDDIHLADDGPDPDDYMSTVRLAAGEIARLLATVSAPLAVTVDRTADGHVTVTYPSAEYDALMTAATLEKQRTRSARASYVIGALEALSELRTYARLGSDHDVTAFGRAARRIRQHVEAQATRRTA